MERYNSLNAVSSSAPSKALISILIVNYRAYEELRACLQSLEQFFASDIEVRIVDHATEASEAERLRRTFPWIHLIDVAENPGFAAGVNRAARGASGEYFLLVNPDCVFREDVARPLATLLTTHPGVGACGALVREADGSVQASARQFPDFTTAFAGRTTWLTQIWPTNAWSRRNLAARETVTPVEVDWVSGACTMIRRRAFEAVGGMDERFFLYWEDADFCRRMKTLGWSTMYYPSVGITHLTGRSSARARKQSLIAFHQSAFRYYQKHAGRAARAASPVVYLALQTRLLLKLGQLQIRRLRLLHTRRIA
jgi:GT2 family glycosyltransferase